MARTGVSVIVGLGALLVGILAIFLEPIQDLLLQKSTEYGIGIPSKLISQPTVIDSPQDIKYIGRRTPGVEHFQNIFYAEDTSGKNRFAPPVPLRHAEGSVIDATKGGAWCPQGTGDILPFTSRITNVSENCLSLRVARPRGTKPEAKLPVMIWIHGGGHALGSAEEILYEPDGLVRQAAADGQPLIFVAINYRLGFFGFATSKAMVEAKQTNAGLRDQRAAFEWVRDHIEAFGGDPQKVTAIGQSVGASDIGLHLTSVEGKRGVPFQKAIMMSGGPGLNFNTKSDLVANNTLSVAHQVGCAENPDIESLSTLECLRGAPVDVLTNLSVTASRAARPPFGEGFFYPTYDGDIITDRPSELMRAGKFVKGVPVIASWVTNDGAWYVPPPTSTDEEVLGSFGLWLYGLSEETKKKLLELYPVKDFEHMVRPEYDGPISPQYYRAAQLNRDIWFTCPVLDFTWQYVKNGGARADQVRLYEHNATRYTPVFKYMGVPMWRVAHLSDIPYVLNVQHLGGGADNSPSQLELARSMSRTIAKFVTSDANSGVEGWPPAFSEASKKEWVEEFPKKLSLEVFGRAGGNETVKVEKGMDENVTSEGGKAVLWEKLFERCEFINSEKMREESGV